MDASGDPPQFGERPLGQSLRLRRAGGGVRVTGFLRRRAQHPQKERETDEALLCAVVQVALELLPLCVRRLDDARP